MNQQKPAHGFQIMLPDELFSDIIAEGPGLPPGSIRAVHVRDDIVYRGFCVTVLSRDKSHPELELGKEYPCAQYEIEVVEVNSPYKRFKEKVARLVFLDE